MSGSSRVFSHNTALQPFFHSFPFPFLFGKVLGLGHIQKHYRGADEEQESPLRALARQEIYTCVYPFIYIFATSTLLYPPPL
jgi:hypothetical protein